MNFLRKNKLLLSIGIAFVASCSQIHFLSDEDKAKSTPAEIHVGNVRENLPENVVESVKKSSLQDVKIVNFCDKIQKRFNDYGWGDSRCKERNWKNVRHSVNGDPLIWTVYGDESNVEEKESTIIMCGVHGDEITPIKFCFDVIDYLDKIAAGEVVDNVNGAAHDFKNRVIVVAPIVNPDSFFIQKPTRTNANGVDVNRNFPTVDFNKDALRLWKTRYKQQKRRYPGKHAMSEPEVVFQVNLIKRYSPDKILSVHAPLTMLDYDGPVDQVSGGDVGSRANQLLIQMSEKAQGYRIKNYPFFPGSLGNYAGNERNIPTYTLELPTSDYRKHKQYWDLFQGAIHSAILHDMAKDIDVAYKRAKSAQKNNAN